MLMLMLKWEGNRITPLVCYLHGRTAVTDGCRKKRPTSGVETKESDESVSRTTSLVFTEETVTPAG
jgi:hypothetical protein